MTATKPSPTTTGRDRVPLLELRGVTRTFKDGRAARNVLNGIDLVVYPGEFVSIMGPSGSGKSTLLRIAGGLDRPDSGHVAAGGQTLSGSSTRQLAAMRRDRIGFVEQHLNLLGVLNPVENVALPLELGGMKRSEAEQLAVAALERMGLGDFLDADVDELSGGERQRVAIARALIGSRQILLADEPTGALDSLTGESVIRQLRDRCDQDGAAVVIATHNAAHAAWADRILYIRDGQLVSETGIQP